jgi:CRISPR-associated protein Cas4
MLPVSWLATYDYCARKLFLERVLKLLVVPKEAMVKGSIRHETQDLINKKEEAIVKSIKEFIPQEKLLELYKNHHARFLRETIIKNKPLLREVNLSLIDVFKTSWPHILIESNERSQNLFKFISVNRIFGDELWERLIPKIESEIKVESENLNLIGKIDELQVYPDKVVPVELKTGKAPNTGVWGGHKLQLGAYIMILEEQGKNTVEGHIKYLEVNESRPIMMNPLFKEKILKIRDEVATLLNSTNIPEYVENRNKCTPCSMREQCYNQSFINEKMRELKEKK